MPLYNHLLLFNTLTTTVSHHDPELTFNHSFIEPPSSGWVTEGSSFDSDEEEGEALYCVPPREGKKRDTTKICISLFPLHHISRGSTFLPPSLWQTFQRWRGASSRKWAPSVTCSWTRLASAVRTSLHPSTSLAPPASLNPSGHLCLLQRAPASAPRRGVARLRTLPVSLDIHAANPSHPGGF